MAPPWPLEVLARLESLNKVGEPVNLVPIELEPRQRECWILGEWRQRSLDREVLVTAQVDFAGQWNEPERARRGMGDVEEGGARLRVQVLVVLLGAALEAVVGVARAVEISV